jgi:sporulation protein YlmC with PRC-barrel domain
MSRRIATLTALAALAVTPALAQSVNPNPIDQPTTPLTQNSSSAMTGTFLSTQSSDQWLATKLIGLTVVDSANAKIGSVNDLVLDPSGNVTAAVIGVGGFLGIGEKNVAISFKSLNISRASDGSEKATIQVSKNELESAAAFKPYQPPRPTAEPRPLVPARPQGNM